MEKVIHTRAKLCMQKTNLHH